MAEPRRPSIPILYTRGTHYEVGYDIVSIKIILDLDFARFLFYQGRTFQSMIELHVNRNPHLNQVLLQKYTSSKIRRIYENILKNVEKNYPQYIEELNGMAEGSKVPFFKVIPSF